MIVSMGVNGSESVSVWFALEYVSISVSVVQVNVSQCV